MKNNLLVTVSLAVEDGMITKPDKKAHFDLFEFENRNFAGRIKKTIYYDRFNCFKHQL